MAGYLYRINKGIFHKLFIVSIFVFASMSSVWGQDPTTSISPNDTTICADLSSFYIDFATASNYSTLLWGTNGTGTFSPTNNQTTTYFPTAGDKTAGLVILKLYAYPIGPATHIDSSQIILRFNNVIPNIANPGNPIACDSYTLPAIIGTNLSGGQAYYTATGGGGTQYNAGDIISSTTLLYIYDSNGSCSDEENFTITITDSPDITNPGAQAACNSYTLPVIGGSNLSGNEAYYTGSGGTGTQYNPGQLITSTTTLFIYDINGSCSDEESFLITITNSPNIANPGNQVACDSYTLPAISGTNLSGGQAYFTGSGGIGSQYNAGESISSTTLLYIYDANGSCSDEESFTITIIDTPSINPIADQPVCDSYILPVITGSDLSGNQAYYTGSGGTGTQYSAGQSITSTTTLFLYDSNGSCSDEKSFTITITNTPTVNDIPPQIACDNYTLPAITGSNLTGNQAYYTASGGVGIRYIAGQIINSSTTLYIYDSNGSCSSEEDFNITINLTPNITNPGNQSVCDSYTLPAITGSNLSGSQAYYTGSGGTGSQLNPGELVSNTTTLFIYDANGSCSYEENFTITVTNTPSFTGVSNQTVCDAYVLPTITGSNLSGSEAYYTGTNGSGVQYAAGDIINTSTTLYIYDNNGSCSNQESFDITIVSSPAINNPGAQFVCDSYTLPPISGSNLSGNEAYYTGTNGSGIQYNPGDNITSTTILYIYDSNGSCNNEVAFNITVTNTPIVNDIADVPDCDNYTLPAITGTNLTGNQAYYTASGGAGTQYNPGQILTSNITLYIYDNNGICSSEEQFSITINATPTVDNPGNQNACDSYTLPPITGSNLSGSQAYYTAPNGGGVTYIPGQTLTTTTTLYVYDSNGNCSDQEQFTVNITNSPNITSIADQLECINYTLPPITGTNLVDPAYYTATGGTGIRYDAGDVINASTFLYIYDISGSCFDEENFTITILPPPVVNDPGDQTECGSYQLPPITGTDLSGNQAYYTAPNGGGTRYDAGDIITASDVIFVFDNNGSCTTEESFDVTIVPTPTIEAGANRSICGITVHTLSASGTGYDASTISWSIIQGDGSLSATNIPNPAYTPTADDYLNPVQLRISVDGIASCAGTTVTDDIYLYYSENVIVDAGPASALICEGQTYSPTPSTNTPSAYLWTHNGDGSFDNDAILNTTYTPGAADIAAGTVTLTLEATGTGTCSGNSIDEVVLVIRSLPTADAGPAIVNICEDDTYFTVDASASNYDNVSWAIIDGTGNLGNPNNLTGAEYIPSAADITNGYAILRLTVTSNDPCYTTAIDDIRVEFTNEPEITVGTIPTLCESVPYLVNIADTAYASSVLWTLTNGSGVLTNASTINPTYTPNATDVTNGSIVLTLEAFPTNPCTNSTTEPITFSIAGAPTVNVGNDITVCSGTTAIPLNPTVTNGVSYLWTTTGSGTFSPSNTAVNPDYIPHSSDYAGGVTLTLEVTGDASCSTTVSNDLDISFTPAPTATVDPTASICEGNSYFISSAVATNYSSILWTHNGNGTLAGSNLEKPTYTPDPLDTGNVVTLTMTVSGNGSCADATDQILLSILREAEADIVTSDAYTCGTTYQITSATANNYSGLTWTTSGDGSFDFPTNLNPIYTFGANDIANAIVSLTLTASPNAPCATDAIDAIVVHLVNGPVANAGPDVSICETQDYITSSASTTNATSVEWTIINGTGTLDNSNNLATSYHPSANDINLGTITLRLTAYGNISCPEHFDDITITISKQPEIFAGDPVNVCLGSTYQVTDAIANYTSGYSWTSDGHGNLTNATTLTPSYQSHIDDININGGVVHLTLNGLPNAPCANNVISVKTLTIIEEPTAFAGNDAFVCAGADYPIQTATATNASDYVWTSSTGGVFTNNGTLTPTYHVNSTDAAQGWVDITLSAVPISPCFTPATHTFRLTVLSGSISYAGADETICADDNYVNADANPTDYTSLLWETSGDGAFSSNTALHPTYSPGAADIVNGYVTLTLHAYGDGNNGCNHDFSELNLTINKLPTADAGPMTEICEGSNTITGASATNASGYQWIIVTGTGTLSNANSLTPIYNTSAGDVAAGTVILELEALPNAPCGTSAFSTLTLSVVDAPTADAGADATVCRQTPYSLAGATSNSLTNTFQWTSSGSGTFSSSSALNPVYTPSAGDVLSRSVTLTLTASNGSCTTAIDNMVLSIESTQVDAGADAAICVNSTYTASANITGNYGTIFWSENGNGSIISGGNTLTPIYQPDATDAGTTVTLTITVDEVAPCAGTVSDALSLEIMDLPTATLGGDLTICEDENLTIAPLYAAATNYTNIFWTTSGDGGFTFSGSDLEPTYIPGANDLAQGFADLTMHVENTPCIEATDQMRLSFSYLPVVDAGLDATVDVLASYTITTSTATNYSSVSWSTSGNGTITGGTTLTPTYQTVASDFETSVIMTLTAIPNGVCTTPVTDYMIITVGDSPAVDFYWVSSCAGTFTEFLIDQTVTNMATIASYAWYFGDGNTSSDAEPTNTYATAGTYTVTLTVTDLSGYTNVIQHLVTVNPVPLPNFTYIQPSCSGLTTEFEDQTIAPSGYIVEWNWDFGDGNDTIITFPASNSGDIDHIYANSGTFQVMLTVTSSDSCTNTVIRNISVTEAPIANYTYSNTCLGNYTSFTDASTITGNNAIASWDWNFGDPASGITITSSEQNPQHLFLSDGDYGVSLTVTNINGCSNTFTDTITVALPPTLEFTYSSGCLDTSIQFEVDQTVTDIATISNWTWDFGDGITSTDQDPEHTYTQSGIYTVSLTALNLNGCSFTVSHLIEIYVAPVANFDNNEPTCQNNLVQFIDYSFTPTGTSITEWVWDFGDGSDTTVLAPNDPNIQHQYSSDGPFTVTLVITNSNGCVSSLSKEITILPLPIADFEYSVTCLDEVVQFTDQTFLNGGGNILSWNWDFGDPDSDVNNTSTVQNPIHQYNASGTYRVILQVKNSQGCIDTISQNITINELPEVEFNIDNSCLDTEVLFTVDTTITIINNIATYFWEFGDGENSNEQNPTHIYPVDGTYTITLTVTDLNGCSNSVSHNMSLSALPLSLFGYSESQCNSEPIQFNNFSTTESGYIVEWHWDFGDGNDTTINFPDNPNTPHLYASEGTYAVTLTVTNSNGCIGTSNQDITILPSPIANFYYESLCLNAPANFTDLSQQNGGGQIVSWDWDFGDPTSGINNTSTRQNPIHQYDVSGTYPVSLTITNAEGCQNIYEDSIVVTNAPDLEPFGFSDTICANTEAEFFMSTNVNLGDVQTILWDFGDPLSGADNTSSEQNPVHIYTSSGEYIITLTLDNNNCGGSISDTIFVNAQPQAQFEYENACAGNPTVFTDLSFYADSPIEIWNWDFGILTRDDDVSDLQNPTYTYTKGEEYTVSLIITDANGCSDQSQQNIQVQLSPTSAFSLEDNFENTQGRIALFNESEGATEYNWIFGDGGLSFEENPIYSYLEDGSYLIELISWNENDCSDTATQVYDLLFKGLFVPSAFAPNNPNLDVAVFKAVGINLESYKIEVFDSWGNLVWESTALDEEGRPSESWDGTIRNKAVPTGVYIWKASGIFRDGTFWEGKDMGNSEDGIGKTFGTITLIR